MPKSIEIVLRMVEEGRLTAEEAASILAALDGSSERPNGPAGAAEPADSHASGSTEPGRGRWVKVEVSDGGRTVDLKLRPRSARRPWGTPRPCRRGDGAHPRGAADPAPRRNLRVLDADGSGVRIVVE